MHVPGLATTGVATTSLPQVDAPQLSATTRGLRTIIERMGRDRIQHFVSKYHDTATGMGPVHVNDLRYTSMMVRNNTIAWLRKGYGRGLFSIIDEVLKWSKVIEEVTLTRYKVQSIEDQEKDYMKNFYFQEGEDYSYNYRLPNKTKTFKHFRNKTDRVREAATSIVLEMYSIHQESLLTEDEIRERNQQWCTSQLEKNIDRMKRNQRKQEKRRIEFERRFQGKEREFDTDFENELYERVLKNINNWKPSLD